MVGDPPLVDRRERRDGARRAREVAEVFGGEQQARVPAAPALVDVHELRPQVGHLRRSFQFERRKAFGCLNERSLRLDGRSLRLHPFLHAQIALDLELP